MSGSARHRAAASANQVADHIGGSGAHSDTDDHHEA
jgi:hypothetical protein